MVWTNIETNVGHTVTSFDPPSALTFTPLDIVLFQPGETVTYAFDSAEISPPGIYYFLSMTETTLKGKITVLGESRLCS